MKATWSANWTDDLGGGPKLTQDDPVLQKLSEKITLDVEQTFMFYLPRICEHCPNAACAASCPAGAIYERAEDDIVLVDQDRCGGWRMCVTGCPCNHRIGTAEKCTFYVSRIEVGLPMICAETCIGRLRSIAGVLYDADKVLGAVSVGDDKDLDRAQREVFLDPGDPAVQRAAEGAGIRRDWVQAAQRSPVWALINRFEVALPLHPEGRTLPMVWCIPSLSPVVDSLTETGHDGENAGNLFGAMANLPPESRCPVRPQQRDPF